MASSSSSSFPALATSSSQSCSYHVFLNFRGEDTRKTFVDHLYTALDARIVVTYKDDEKLPRGESIRPALFSAIEGSQIAVVIISKNYADSSWCLDELEYIMRCKANRGLIVMPVFYDVVPSEVRKQNGNFGRGFDKQRLKNNNKVELWRKALVDASDISGWEVKNTANGHEAKVVQEVVDTISNKLFYASSSVDKNLPGMKNRLRQLKEQLKVGSGGVRMVGVWGLGGIGKTTLASSLFMKVSHHFQGNCIIENVRLESSKQGLKTLQENLLSTLLKLKTKMNISSVEEGKHMIRSRLKNSKVLILLDDVNERNQLDALAGSHSWFGSGSRIIITTRDEHLLRSHKVDLVCPVTLLSHEEAVMLFDKHAYNKYNPVNDYKKLSSHVVSYADGLPLALKVLGSLLYDKNQKQWLSSLSRLKDIPDKDIVKILKISYDGLEHVEQELFLDIACFYRGHVTEKCSLSDHDPMEVFEACGYHPVIGIKVLEQKALITIGDGRFEMHDLVQEMGHYIVRGEHPNNPEKHNRVWNYKDIMCLGDATKENHKNEAIRYWEHSLLDSNLSPFCKIVSNMKKLKYLSVILSHGDIDKSFEGPDFLSNELRYFRWEHYPASPFPDSFQPRKLVVLKLYSSLQMHLWRDYKYLHLLKVLLLKDMKNLLSTPNFDGLPSLQKLTIYKCDELQEIHPSLGKHTSLEYVDVLFCNKLRNFPTIVNMGNLKTLQITNYRMLRKFPTIVNMGNLKTLQITDCHESLEFPELESNMKSLVKLSLHNMGIDALLPSFGDRCPNLISIQLNNCSYAKNKELISTQLSNFRWRLVFLQKLDMSRCGLKDGQIPSDIGELSNLQELDLSSNDFTRLDFSLSQLTRLKLLDVSRCKRLVELPKLPSRIAVLKADYCNSLTRLGYAYRDCKWLCKVSLLCGGVITDGNISLQSLSTMIKGNAIKRHPMIMEVEGLEIAKVFRPRLVKGDRVRFRLPENWSTDFSGFLICVVEKHKRYNRIGFKSIRMEKVVSSMDYENDVVWEESNGDNRTQVCYVPFVSLKNTAWWNSAYKEVLFTSGRAISTSGLGVNLVAMKSGSGTLERLTTQEEYEFSNYAPKLTIGWDSLSVSISF